MEINEKKTNFVQIIRWQLAEELHSTATDKVSRYKEVLPQIKALVDGESDLIANLANVSAALKQTFGFFWVGFYFVKKEELVLGPFQGSIACTRIKKGKGVCGHVFVTGKTEIVPDVDAFPGHIACSSLSKSEIVVPIIRNNEVLAVLDVDSDVPDDFDQTDELYLNELCTWLADHF